MQDITQNTQFLHVLAHLMYAIAAADNKIVREEKLRIVNLVQDEWAAGSEEHRDVIYSTLRALIEQETGKEEALSVFKDFYNQNKDLFPLELKQRIMETAFSIANAFAKKNKSEVVILSQVYLLLGKPPRK